MNTAITNLRFLAFIYSLVNIYSTILSPLSIEVKIHDNAHMWDSMCLRFQLDHFLRFCIGQCPIRRFVYFEILTKKIYKQIFYWWNEISSKAKFGFFFSEIFRVATFHKSSIFTLLYLTQFTCMYHTPARLGSHASATN